MSDSVWPHRRQPTRLPHPWDSPGKDTGVGFHYYTAKWFNYMQIHIYIYIYIYIYACTFFSILVYHRILHVLYSRTLLFIYPIYTSLHLLISSSQSFPPLLLSLLATTSLFCMSVSLFLFCRYLCCILDSTYKCYHMVFFFL